MTGQSDGARWQRHTTGWPVVFQVGVISQSLFRGSGTLGPARVGSSVRPAG